MILKQIKQNAVALISLVVALTSLSYNTWRNEQTEANRNVRTAGLETILALAELERTVFLAHYDQDQDAGNPRVGWAQVLGIRDLSLLMPAVVQSVCDAELKQTWEAHWSTLMASENSAQAISMSIDHCRDQVTDSLLLLR